SGISLEHLDLSAQEPPAVVQNCAIRSGSIIGIRVSGYLTYRVPASCRRIILRENRIEGCLGGILLIGAVESVQVVGNRISGADEVGIQVENLLATPKNVLLANNTLFNCHYAFRLWDSAVKGARGCSSATT